MLARKQTNVMDEMDELLQNGSLSSLVHIIFSILKHIMCCMAKYWVTSLVNCPTLEMQKYINIILNFVNEKALLSKSQKVDS